MRVFTAAMVFLLAILGASCSSEPAREALDELHVGRAQNAIIECNESSVGQPCDTDDDVCTQEICRQVGQNVFCDLDQVAPDGTSCQSDGLPCTLDSCVSGVCEHTALALGTLCDDGLFCTSGEACDVQSACTGGVPACDDGDDCTADTCDETSNSCDNTVVVGMACDDGDLCTVGTTCAGNGSCSGGSALDCDDSDDCTTDSCDPAAGCANVIAPGSACDDDLFCSTGETCAADGQCAGTLTCVDNNSCTLDSCDESADTCSNPVDQGAACNDGNVCTELEACQADGSCEGTPVADNTTCTAAGGCQIAGTCQGGSCTGTTPQPDLTTCDDGNACTENDRCASGACEGTPIDCEDHDECTINGCDPVLGCLSEVIADCYPPDAGPAPDAGASDAGSADAGVGMGDAAAPDAGAGVLGGGGCGCQSSSKSGGFLALLVVLLALLLQARRRSAALCLALVSWAAAAASARADGFDSEIFQPAASSTAFFSQEEARVLGSGVFNLGATFNIATDPLVLRDPETGEPLMDGVVVSSRTGAQLAAAIGLFDRLELSLALPVTLTQNGDGSQLASSPDLDGGSLGDARLQAKLHAFAAGSFSLGAALTAAIPTGDASAFGGGDSLSMTPRLLLGVRRDRLAFSVNAGYEWRKRSRVGDLVVDDEIVFGAGAAVELAARKLWALGEVYGSAARADRRAESTPAESVFGARYAIAGPWMLSAAMGIGLGAGYGTPELRGVLSFAYAPQRPEPSEPEPVVEPEVVVAPEPPPPTDKDGDGIFDSKDACPDEAEDKDGFQDEDGCPDDDNDGDKIADAQDACPDEAEVLNGINDTDGCPDQGLIVMTEDRVIVEEKVLFDVARARVKRQGRATLEAIITMFQQHPEWDRLIVEGHTDSRGAPKYNQWLSEKRAKKVREAMINLGMPADQIEAVGYGETRQRVEGTDEESWAKNRRVEFVVITKKQELKEVPLGTPTPTDAEVPGAQTPPESGAEAPGDLAVPDL